MFAFNRRWVITALVLGACPLAGASCSSSKSPAGGSGGATAGSGGAPAGGTKADSGSETDAAALLPAPVLDPDWDLRWKDLRRVGSSVVEMDHGTSGPGLSSQGQHRGALRDGAVRRW